MATPADLITTINGRRCTRTRVRSSVATPTQEQQQDGESSPIVAPEIQEPVASSPVAAAPPDFPPELSIQAPEVFTTDPLPPATAISSNAAAASTSIAPVIAQPNIIDPASIDAIPAVPATTRTSPSILPAISIAPDQGEALSSPTLAPSPSAQDPTPSPGFTPIRGGNEANPSPTVAPDTGGGGKALGVAVGGAVAGAISIFIIIALVIIYMRKRKSNRWSFGEWKTQMDEKRRADDGSNDSALATQLQSWIQGLRDRTGSALGFVSGRFKPRDDDGEKGNVRNTQAGTISNYSRSSTRSSLRSRSLSAPPNMGARIVDRLKDWKQLLALGRIRRGPPSIGRPSSPFTPTITGPIAVRRNSNPFDDPPTETVLRAVNPDTPDDQRRATLKQGLANQQRAPITPVRQTIVNRPKLLRDPFADPTGVPSGTPEYLRGNRKHVRKNSEPLRSNPPGRSPLNNGTAADYYLGIDHQANPFADPVEPSRMNKPQPAHLRELSQSSGSFILQAGIRDSTDSIKTKPPSGAAAAGRSGVGPAAATSLAPAALAPALPSNLPASARESTASANTEILFGEPGPSRPTTGFFPPFTPFTPASRAFRGKSDPFDLDRPEVLGFGNVMGRREVRASVTRMNSKHNRHSSTPGWGTLGAEGADQVRESQNFSIPRRPSNTTGVPVLGGGAGGPGKPR